MPLTELEIKNLKPRDKRYIVGDGRGLALEIMSSGAASWRYRYQFRGKTEKVSLGSYPHDRIALSCGLQLRDQGIPILD
jgi:hypothetical protein